MEKSRLISSLHDVLLENIKNAFLAIPKNNQVFHSILRNLQETLVSMKPLLLVQMVPTMEQMFRSLLETLDSHIPHLARFKEKLPTFDTSYMTKLEDLKERLRKFYTDYVQDQIRIYEVEGTYGPAEGGFTNVYWLSGEVLNMIRTEIAKASYSVKPSLEKFDIILVSLLRKNHHDDTSEILRLLKGVRVCVHFLNGHHGIDIQKYLRDYEQELRRFIEEETRMQLENLDRRYEERRRNKDKVESGMIKFFGASVVAYITYTPQTPISSIFFMAAVIVFVSLFESDIVNLILTGVVVAPFTFPTETLSYWVLVIGALIFFLYLFKSEIHDIWPSTERQRKKCEDQPELHEEEVEDESYVILFLAAIVSTTVVCFTYWQNTSISCIVFIGVIVLLVNYFRFKILVRQRRNSKDELENFIMFFKVNFVIGAVILFLSLFKPEISGKEDINSEIFLSFRGSDTRYIFASSLHNNLEKANIRTFFDERNMIKGKNIWEEIQREIRTSVGAIIILSENYAESEDCLDELLQIQKRARKYQHYILKPIFYDVKPEHLTDKRSKFYQALQNHRNTKKIKEWAGALETITRFAGYTYTSNWDHMDVLIDRIVGDVKRYLRTSNGRQVRKHI